MPDTAGLAIDLAMEEARGNPALQGHVAAFLDDQRGLIADQRHHMRIQLRQLHLGIAEKWLGVLLRVAAAFTGVAVAAGLGYLIWNAAQSSDLVIDSFQVPPDLVARGFSGPVLAAKLSDKITAMQTQTKSQRAPRSYSNNWGENLKVEIPETGVSFSELDRFLRQKLGHDLHIGGEIVQTAKGIALTARAGPNGDATVTGTEADMDSLLQKLAEQVYRLTQPYRYAAWLPSGREAEGISVLQQVAASGPPRERAWAYNGWAVNLFVQKGERATLPLLQRGHELDPDNYLLIANLGASSTRRGRLEESIRWYRLAQAALAAHGRDYSQPDRIEALGHSYNAILLERQGALLEAARERRVSANISTLGIGQGLAALAAVLAPLHEPAAARAALAEFNASPFVANNQITFVNVLNAGLSIMAETQDWTAAPSLERIFTAALVKSPGYADDKPTMLDPFMALAQAHLGRFAQAEARIARTPGDCYPCLRARAQIAALQGQNGRTDWWFARAVAIGPSLPYAEEQWGRALLDRRQPDTAIEKFAAASKKGPKFADPLEYWGEALMAKNQSHLALAKFKEAEKYAPNWGRLHLKWGEALVYAGKKDEAKKQFARAGELDLTPSEKSELARHP